MNDRRRIRGTRSAPRTRIRISHGRGLGERRTGLTGKCSRAIRIGAPDPLVSATTFTRKAAAELLDRVSAKLVNEGLFRAAAEIREARIGTVHGVCGGLLRDYAFEAGLPVRQNVLDEVRATRLFRRSLTSVLTDRELDTLDRSLASSFDRRLAQGCRVDRENGPLERDLTGWVRAPRSCEYRQDRRGARAGSRRLRQLRHASLRNPARTRTDRFIAQRRDEGHEGSVRAALSLRYRAFGRP